MGVIMQPIVKVRVGNRGARSSPVENRSPPLVDHVFSRAIMPTKQQTSVFSLTTKKHTLLGERESCDEEGEGEKIS